MRETSGSHAGPIGFPWYYEDDAERLNRPAILVVEDDPDIRDMLGTLLRLAGFVSVECESAEAGLEALRERSFDLVLTDYALPSRSGLWLLRQAESEGLIQDIPALIVTAHPNVDDAAPFEVIHKPFDLDDLVERVRRHMGTSDRRRKDFLPPAAAPDRAGGGRNGGEPPECPQPIELILYVSASSPRSASALRNIKRALSRFGRRKVRLTVCDLSVEPMAGVADSIAFTPTLVRRTPGPRTFILGHVSSPELLMELLGDCESDES